MQCPDSAGGKKAICPKCGQKILIPTPPAPALFRANKTTLGKLEEGVAASPIPPLATLAPPARAAPQFGVDLVQFELPQPAPQPSHAPQTHSGLGIASFLIALLVGGMDVILIFVIAVNMATVRGQPLREGLVAQASGGGLSLYCLNCRRSPLCVVGVGLGSGVGNAHKERKHRLAWI